MVYKEEKFIIKEFLVGLLVILIVLTFVLAGVRRLTSGLKLGNAFSKNTKAAEKVVSLDYCKDLAVFNNIHENQTVKYDRVLKKQGLADEKKQYTINFIETTGDKIGFELTSDDPGIYSYKNHYNCGSGELNSTGFDPLLLSALTNSPPDKLNGVITYAPSDSKLVLFRKSENGATWENILNVKGIKDSKFCLNLQAAGRAQNQGVEKIKVGDSEIDAYKITTNWQATVSASLTSEKTSQQCMDYDGSYDTTASLDVSDEVWYTSNGMVKRHLTPKNLKGNYYFLPSAGLPVETVDEVVR